VVAICCEGKGLAAQQGNTRRAAEAGAFNNWPSCSTEASGAPCTQLASGCGLATAESAAGNPGSARITTAGLS